jgi:hypothetical protein
MAIAVASFSQVANWFDEPATASIAGLSWNSTEVVVVVGGKEHGLNTLAAPTNANLTFTQRVMQRTDANESVAAIWTAVAGSSQTSQTIQITDANAQHYGFAVWVLSGASGSFANASGGLTEAGFTFTPTAGSAVIYGCFDWAATSGKTIATGTGTATERVDTTNGTSYGIYLGDWVGVTASSTTFGVTSYTGMQVAHGVIEVLADAAPPPPFTNLIVRPIQSGRVWR